MLRLFKREYSNYSMHAGRLVSNVLTSMLSGVPGSINREPLESSLLTTWPFWAGRPGANTVQYFLMFWTETSLWIKLCVNIVYSCVAVVLRACVLMIMDDVNRKRPDAICTGAACADLNSPWSFSIAVLILLLSMEPIDIRSSLEPWMTTRKKWKLGGC